MILRSKSTASQERPRSSDTRMPVQTAVTKTGRQRPRARSSSSEISSFDGTSTPTTSLPCSRFLLLLYCRRLFLDNGSGPYDRLICSPKAADVCRPNRVGMDPDRDNPGDREHHPEPQQPASNVHH